MIEALSSNKLPSPKFRYSPLIKAGPVYQTAGMVALDVGSGQLVSGGTYRETQTILNNLLSALPDFDLSITEMVGARIYTTRFDRFSDINRAWNEVFVDGVRPPARTAVGVVALPMGATVEMEFSFFKSDSGEI